MKAQVVAAIPTSNEVISDDGVHIATSEISPLDRPFLLGDSDTYGDLVNPFGFILCKHQSDLKRWHFLARPDLSVTPHPEMDELRYWALNNIHLDPICKVFCADTLSLTHVYESRAFGKHPVYILMDGEAITIQKDRPIFTEDRVCIFEPDYDRFLDMRHILVESLLVLSYDLIASIHILGDGDPVRNIFMIDEDSWEDITSVYCDWYK